MKVYKDMNVNYINIDGHGKMRLTYTDQIWGGKSYNINQHLVTDADGKDPKHALHTSVSLLTDWMVIKSMKLSYLGRIIRHACL